MTTFFISYTASDQSWAEWIAWQLEDFGHTAIVQAWDFRPGSNFVLEMQKASESASATLAILSSEYLQKAFPSSEWAAAFVQDPNGQRKALIPVRVSDIKPQGLLSSIVYIDLFSATDEEDAVKKLLNGITPTRKKPMRAPIFPKNLWQAKRPPFPANPSSTLQEADRDKEELEIEIRINRRFDDFTPPEQEKLIRAIRELLAIDYNLRVTKITRGSVLMTLRLNKRDGLRLFILNHIGKLRQLDITGLTIKALPTISIDDAISEALVTEPIPIVIGERETGTVVFLAREAGYGIIERTRGGFIKFTISEDSGSFSLGNIVTISREHGTSDTSETDGPNTRR